MIDKDNINEEKINKLEEKKNDEFLIKNLKKNLFVKYISENTTDAQEEQYKELLEEKYQSTYREMIRIVSLRDYDQEAFEKEISQQKNQKMFLEFMHEDKFKESNIEESFRSLTKEDLQKHAKRPEEYLYVMHFDDEFHKKLTQIFDTQMDTMNQRIDKEVDAVKRVKLKSTGKKVENPLKEAMLSLCTKEYGLKAIQLGLAASNPVSASVFAAKTIVQSKAFKKVSNKLKNKISEKLDNSEVFQKFKNNNSWISKLKKSKKLNKVFAIGAPLLAIGAGVGYALASGDIESLEIAKNATVDYFNENVNMDNIFPSNDSVPNGGESNTNTVSTEASPKEITNTPEVNTSENNTQQTPSDSSNKNLENNETSVEPFDGGTIEVKEGDNPWKIAKSVLGSDATDAEILKYTEDMYEANKDVFPKYMENPNHIEPGWNLTLPPTEDPSLTDKLNDLQNRGKQALSGKMVPR